MSSRRIPKPWTWIEQIQCNDSLINTLNPQIMQQTISRRQLPRFVSQSVLLVEQFTPNNKREESTQMVINSTRHEYVKWVPTIT